MEEIMEINEANNETPDKKPRRRRSSGPRSGLAKKVKLYEKTEAELKKLRAKREKLEKAIADAETLQANLKEELSKTFGN